MNGIVFPATPATAVDPREQLGITLDADTVFCEDCGFIGLALDSRCRKCAGHALTKLANALQREQPAPRTADPAPVHPVEVRISIGAENFAYVQAVMRELTEYAERRDSSTFAMCSGGWSGSYSVTTKTRDISPDAYRDELETWRQQLKGETNV